MGLITKALQHPVLISYLSGANNYSFVHFRSGEQLMISKSLRFLEKLLPDFIRIHKSTLLNPICIKKLQNQPHSKTSGAVVLEDGTLLSVSRRQWPILARSVWTDDQITVKPERSIILLSGDINKSLLLRQLINDYWPLTLLHVIDNGAILPQLLLAEYDRPELLIIDLRQSTSIRLALLRELRETPKLSQLPVILLVAPDTSGGTRSEYALQANSVVVIPDDMSQFVRVMEQVCRSWLTTTSLTTN